MVKNLYNLLSPKMQTKVVDVGANPIDSIPPYKKLLDSGCASLVGFEPQPEALKRLLQEKGDNESYLPYVIGDGKIHSLQFCRSVGFTSLLEPDPTSLSLFDYFKPLGQVLSREEVQTKRLDALEEITSIDFLKIDIQGGELSVFQNGREMLSQAVMIQTEVSFVTLYQDQPTIGDVDLELRQQGFVPHCFAEIKKWPISPCVINGDQTKPLNQLLEADLVYIRDIRKDDQLSDEQLKHMALLAHACYKSFDLSYRCIWLLEQRGVISTGSLQRYAEIVSHSF